MEGSMRYKVDPEFEGQSAVKFVADFLDLFDTTPLSEFKIRKSQVDGGRYKGIHGQCKPPGYPNARMLTYRITCSVSGSDADFPLTGPRGYHAGVTRCEYVAENVNELIAFVCGHELYHYLGRATQPRHCSTAQIDAPMESERRADLMGYEFLYAVREGREPVEVADAIMNGDTVLVAPQRYPYRPYRRS